MVDSNCYFTVEGLSGGHGDYKCKFDNLLDAVNDFKERGYDMYDGSGDIILHIFIAENIEQVIKLI